MKRKTLIILIIISFAFQSHAQLRFSYSQFINGYWGEWSKSYQYQSYNNTYLVHYYFKGTYTDFIIYKANDHPSNYIARFVMKDKDAVNKILFSQLFSKDRKKALKEDQWFKFEGHIEYFAQDGEAFVRSFPYGASTSSEKHKRYLEKVIIRVAPFKEKPSLYNIYFQDSMGNIGLALQI